METNLISETLTAVNLFLKDGRRLTGQLINSVNSNEEGPWKFVSNWNYQEYEKTHSPNCVEIYPTEMIDHIDPYLK